MSEDSCSQSSFIAQLSGCDELNSDELAELESYIQGVAQPSIGRVLTEEQVAEPVKAESPASPLPDQADQLVDIRKLIGEMNLADKLKTAMFGNAACRSILINNPNKMIQLAVLENPKLQFIEVEEFSRNKNLSDVVLRGISDNRNWSGEYSVRLNLVRNPKTPPDVSLKWLRYLRTSDLKNLARSRDVPQLVSVTARKRLAEKQDKK